MAKVIKIGLGQTPSGKVLEKDTRFFIFNRLASIKAALDYWNEHKEKKAFVSLNNKAYRRITMMEIRAIIENYKPWEKRFNSSLGRITVTENVKRDNSISYVISLNEAKVGEIETDLYPMSKTFKEWIIKFIENKKH